MKILCLYGYPDYNKGDSAICLGAHQLLKSIYDTEEIYFANFLWPDHPATIRTKAFYEAYNIKTIDIPSRNRTKYEKLTNILVNRDRGVSSFLMEENFDMVISVGGHFLFSKDSDIKEKIRNKVRLLDIYQPILEAKKLGVETGILCQSIGPFNKPDSIIRKIIDNVDFIITRESASYNEIRNKHKDTLASIDMAYFMSIPQVKKRVLEIDGDYVVLNLRKVLASGGYQVADDMFSKQNEYFARLTRELINRNKKVLLISQVTSSDPNDPEVDTILHEEFKSKYFKEESDVKVVKEEYSEYELIDIYKHADALISTRYHGLIFCILASGNPIGVNLSGIGHKLVGMFNDLDIVNNYIELDDAIISKAVSKTINLIEEKNKYNKDKYIESNFEKIKGLLLG
ncbi:polysaccharide pyruvyl transferase family protein [Salinivibrio sp. VYel1]|uniref:polysaccharide pyruvyl transferase family protein n=1 Tax=Salinivibrio sp. VYel1 TaxID=2490490 RepID=UPI00128CD697